MNQISKGPELYESSEQGDEMKSEEEKSVTMEYKELIEEMILGVDFEHPSVAAEDLREDMLVVKSARPEFGDLSVNCVSISRKLGYNPKLLAEKLVEEINANEIPEFSSIDNIGPFLNFRFDRRLYSEKVLSKIFEKGETYGSLEQGKGSKTLWEHSSINPNASPHMGRIRNALIGDFLVQLEEFVGYDVETHYFVNDIGKQISLLQVGVNKYSPMEEPTFEKMLERYMKINKDMEDDPSIEEEALKNLELLENGDKETRENLRRVVERCLNGQVDLLSQLGIEYDYFTYESNLVLEEEKIKEVTNKLLELNKAYYDEDGRLIADLSGYNIPTRSPVVVLTRADGTSLYPLRDVVYIIGKIERSPENNNIVLGEDQKTYMKQVAAILDILGYKAPEAVFYSFVLLKGGKMATREGKVALLSDVLSELKEKTENEFKKRGRKDIEEEKIESIASATIRYSILAASRDKNVNFDMNQVLDFQGESAVSLLYAYARINSILRKADVGEKLDINDVHLEFTTETERQLLNTLGDFPELIDSLLEEKESMPLVRYLRELTKLFSRFYEETLILDDKDSVDRRMSKVLLVKSLSQVMSNGMKILGIKTIETF
jgi:arginyl-tRNA synthetase